MFKFKDSKFVRDVVRLVLMIAFGVYCMWRAYHAKDLHLTLLPMYMSIVFAGMLTMAGVAMLSRRSEDQLDPEIDATEDARDVVAEWASQATTHGSASARRMVLRHARLGRTPRPSLSSEFRGELTPEYA